MDNKMKEIKQARGVMGGAHRNILMQKQEKNWKMFGIDNCF